MSLSGLAQLNIELTSKCDKTHLCPMCGHQNPDVNPITYGDMDFELLRSIRAQLEPGVVVSLHRDGEPTAYPRLRDALDLFEGFTISIVTHGGNLRTRGHDLIGRCTGLTVSVFRGDQDRAEQIEALSWFLREKGDRAPQVQVKIVGDMADEEVQAYHALGVRIIRRLIHVPITNSRYAHRQPTIPEVGICLDLLHRPTIDWEGRFYLCNRLDAKRDGYLGDVRTQTLDEIWNGPERMRMLDAHKRGRRDLANPLCASCTFWGVASE